MGTLLVQRGSKYLMSGPGQPYPKINAYPTQGLGAPPVATPEAKQHKHLSAHQKRERVF